jgi:hypothetical protein
MRRDQRPLANLDAEQQGDELDVVEPALQARRELGARGGDQRRDAALLLVPRVGRGGRVFKLRQ